MTASHFQFQKSIFLRNTDNYIIIAFGVMGMRQTDTPHCACEFEPKAKKEGEKQDFS